MAMGERHSGDDSGHKPPLPNSDGKGLENRSPLRLDYGAPPKRNLLSDLGVISGGVLVSIVLVGWVGMGAWLAPRLGHPSPPVPRAWGWIVAFFASAIFGLFTALVLWRRRPLGRMKLFLLGLLIGLGVIGLLEGACWSVT